MRLQTVTILLPIDNKCLLAFLLKIILLRPLNVIFPLNNIIHFFKHNRSTGGTLGPFQRHKNLAQI